MRAISVLQSPPRRLIATLVILLSFLLIAGVRPSPAAAETGQNGLATVVADNPSPGTGRGNGWVALSYKADGPVVGYLFAPGFRVAGARHTPVDVASIRGFQDTSRIPQKGISFWPWGFATGGFNGCADVYGVDSLHVGLPGTYPALGCEHGPQTIGPDNPHPDPGQPVTYAKLPWWHLETDMFCTDADGDALCSQDGVWAGHKGIWLRPGATLGSTRPAKTIEDQCPVWGNIGAAAAYGSRRSIRPSDQLGSLPAGTKLGVRYVTKNRQFVMAQIPLTVPLVGGIRWGFVPRTCVQATDS